MRAATIALSLWIASLLSCIAGVSMADDALLTWSPVPGASGYLIYARSGGAAYGVPIDVGSPPVSPDGKIRQLGGALAPGQLNTFAVSAYDAAGVEGYRSNEVAVDALGGGHGDLTALGIIVARVTAPQGGGSRDLGVIRDGDMPVPGTHDVLRQYDSYDGNDAAGADWIGYIFPVAQSFSRVVFQEGMHFWDGGWFDTLAVQVLVDGMWIDVPGTSVAPAYPGNNGVAFETFTITLPAVSGTGVRLFGAPGGSADFISVGELRVFGGPAPTAPAATQTPTRTFTHTPTRTRTQTPTHTVTATATRTSTATPSRTATWTATPTVTPAMTHTPTTSSRTPTATPTASAPSSTPTPFPTATPDRRNVRGRVRQYGSGVPMAAVPVAIDGSVAAVVDTDGSGEYALDAPAGATLRIAPLGAAPVLGKVSALDAAYVLQAVAGMRGLTSEQRLACDVSANGALSAFDATLILRRSVGALAEFPAARSCDSEWLFLPAASPLPEQVLHAPFTGDACRMGSIVIDPLTASMADRDFDALAFGDCTFNAPVPALARHAAVVVEPVVRVTWSGQERRRRARLLLEVKSAEPVHALEVELLFDPTRMRARRARLLRRPPGAIVLFNRHLLPGVAALSAASAEPLRMDGSGLLLEVTFAHPDGSADAPPTMSRLLLNGRPVRVTNAGLP